ncbi:hypothetical protein [Actinoplanes aureus]|uniref:Uncharacterized protein n=1 Tax=Actinoplanes aureus TaxID=2792083 RepID=A0A931CLQ6_9ACTN|nr:hypothetical protein [Actinoplanes aureus]MBG0569331.1 hypothetical protein [Actinoplanes aureus]
MEHDDTMHCWTNGDLATEFERRLDDLIAEASPEWQPEELPEPYRSDQRFRAYHRVSAKRTYLGDILKARPSLTAFHAGRVLPPIICDEDVAANEQTIHPVMQAVGRRTVQRYLISAVENEPDHKKVCAVRAWYWSQVSLVYDSVEALHQHRPTPASQATDDEVVDLRSHYRNACLAAFVASDYIPTQEWLARGFLLVKDYYPPTLHHLVARARAIAEAEPDRYKDLLAKNADGTNMAQIGFTDD